MNYSVSFYIFFLSVLKYVANAVVPLVALIEAKEGKRLKWVMVCNFIKALMVSFKKGFIFFLISIPLFNFYFQYLVYYCVPFAVFGFPLASSSYCCNFQITKSISFWLKHSLWFFSLYFNKKKIFYYLTPCMEKNLEEKVQTTCNQYFK